MWDDIKTALRQQMTQATYDQWIEPARATIDDHTLKIHAHSDDAKDWLNLRLRPVILRTVAIIAPDLDTVDIVTNGYNTPSQAAPAPPDDAPAPPQTKADDAPGMHLIQMLGDDRETIPYRHRLNRITGRVTGSILLQQLVYWWIKSGRRPYYKFMRPAPRNKAYRPGDSLCEELGFSRKELDTAIKAIGYKLTTGTSRKDPEAATALVLYWVDGFRLTWYEINEKRLMEQLKNLYS